MRRIALPLALLVAPAFGQAPPADDVADHAKLTALVKAHAAAAQTPHRVRVESLWKSASAPGSERTGTSRLVYSVGSPGELRLAVLPPQKPADAAADTPVWLAVADGKTLTRLHRAGNLYSAVDNARPADLLLTDADAQRALRLAGVDWLLRPDVIASVRAQVTAVDELDRATAAGKPVRRFALGLADGRTAEVDFPADGPPLPVRVSTGRAVPLEGGATYRRRIESTLTWELSPTAVAGEFAAPTPAGAKQVDDLAAAIANDSPAGLVGKPLPELKLQRLDGTDWAAADAKGKGPLVVYLWATWAAPSTETLPAVLTFVNAAAAKGVQFAAINAGEQPADVKAFATQAKLTIPVILDPDGTALHALRVGELPAILVVDNAGVVQAFHRGLRPHTLDRVKADVDALLAGKSVVPQRRPN